MILGVSLLERRRLQVQVDDFLSADKAFTPSFAGLVVLFFIFWLLVPILSSINPREGWTSQL
jgi:hypothetical protein